MRLHIFFSTSTDELSINTIVQHCEEVHASYCVGPAYNTCETQIDMSVRTIKHKQAEASLNIMLRTYLRPNATLDEGRRNLKKNTNKPA